MEGYFSIKYFLLNMLVPCSVLRIQFLFGRKVLDRLLLVTGFIHMTQRTTVFSPITKFITPPTPPPCDKCLQVPMKFSIFCHLFLFGKKLESELIIR